MYRQTMIFLLILSVNSDSTSANNQAPDNQGNSGASENDSFETTRIFADIYNHEHGVFEKEYQGQVSFGKVHTWTYQVDSTEYDDKTIQITTSLEGEGVTASSVQFLVTYKSESMNWNLPMVQGRGAGKRTYTSVTRTMCTYTDHEEVNDPKLNNSSRSNAVHITVSTLDPFSSKVNFNLTINLVDDTVRLDKLKRVNITNFGNPSIFRLEKALKLDEIYSTFALLYIDSPDNICMTVRIQGPECPVQGDHEDDFKLEGIRQSVTQKGAVDLKVSELLEGRYVTILIHEDGTKCEKDDSYTQGQSNYNQNTSVSLIQKEVAFKLVQKISDRMYWFVVMGTPGCYLLFAAAFSLLYFKVLRVSVVLDIPESATQGDTYETGEENPHECHEVPGATPDEAGPDSGTSDQSESLFAKLSEWIARVSKGPPKKEAPIGFPKKKRLNVCKYLANLSLFHLVPVLQVGALYQQIQRGDTDLCYHNYRCLYSLGILQAFNHVFSNIGYEVLGSTFICISWVEKKKRMEELIKVSPAPRLAYELHYAMGYSVIVQGILSGVYHVCPTRLSYQFDTFFMYVTAMVSKIWLYQARRPDSNTGIVFAALSCLVTSIVFVFLEYHFTPIWIIASVLQVLLISFLSFRYYLNAKEHKLPEGTLVKLFGFTVNPRKLTVIRIALLNLFNWGTIVVGMIKFYPTSDLSSHFLTIYVVNLVLYLFNYVLLKYTNGERLTGASLSYLVISISIWIVGLNVLCQWPANWQLSPADSRLLNTDCNIVQFYDIHDIWHFLSGFGLFFLFMFLLTVDDDLKGVLAKPEFKIY